MKKLIAVATMLSLGSLMASETGANTFGVLRVDSDQPRTIVAIPWIQASLTNGEITVADVVKTANLYEGDTIHYYNGEKFESWKLNENKTWDKATSVVGQEIVDTTEAEEKVLSRGNALVLVRPDSDSRESCFYLWGQVASSVPTNEIARSSESMVYNLIAPPLATTTGTVDINGSDVEWSDVQDDDCIYFQTSTNRVECKWSSGKWKKLEAKYTSVGGLNIIDGYDWSDMNSVPAGTGFWYVSTNGTATTKVVWKGAPKIN